jgi:hypothetical protein
MECRRLFNRSRAANAHSKREFMRMTPLVMKTMDEVEVSVNAPGRMAKQARDELALNNELTQ